MSWTRTCEAGAHNTPAMPWIERITAACQISSASVKNSTPQASELSSPCVDEGTFEDFKWEVLGDAALEDFQMTYEPVGVLRTVLGGSD